MLKKIGSSFQLAIQNIRSNFFHTLLSILGIVIGVAALVIILSLIDGMEEFAQQELSRTTNLKAIVIQSEPYKRTNDVRIRKDTFSIWNYDLYFDFQKNFDQDGRSYLTSTLSREISLPDRDTTVGAVIQYVSSSVPQRLFVSAGQVFNEQEVAKAKSAAIVNKAMATALEADSAKWSALIGDSLKIGTQSFAIIAVVSSRSKSPELFVPFTRIAEADRIASLPLCILEANSVEQVPQLKKNIEQWLTTHAGAKSDYSVSTNEFRVEQAAKGFFLFRIIMGLIVGVSVLVGGIGVMNVLLISVTERTAEIGVRKAVGANRNDIIMQFLAESITVSVFGSLTGLLLGFVTTLGLVPIIKMLVKVPFQAAYTWNTFWVVSSIAIVIGIVFGTYPALRAARLDPVEAIRRE